jgi:hypothetical protein
MYQIIQRYFEDWAILVVMVPLIEEGAVEGIPYLG